MVLRTRKAFAMVKLNVQISTVSWAAYLRPKCCSRYELISTAAGLVCLSLRHFRCVHFSLKLCVSVGAIHC